MMTTAAIAELLNYLQPQIGQEIHVGPWLEIDQQRIDKFAEVTGDLQWIHIDPERAEKESPYGSTIAHGYLTLSLLPFLTESNHPDFFQKNYPGMKYRVNYGLNKVRFPSPVKVGSRLRARTVIDQVDEVKKGVQICYRITVEIDGSEKPACVAEFLARVYP
ncbi:Acyl dehydratase [Malonomonas rubra DSM 5091]|uniref:Acyl dehydratase n=1 Tax=Malonomonas rubra DSM 5091 TaxID=1122189 RepID=A0A1M6FHU1_MALRU|nr:MaoC family dehydratase [Malonomonas rubra]SHI97270.1 Acyl dehydratase [Malonomonas rubra DSM 5091]